MDLKLTLSEFNTLLNTLSVPHGEERINDDILHVIIWKNSKKFYYVLHYDGDGTDCYYLYNVFEGV